MKLSVGGKTFKRFTGASLTKSMDVCTRSFSFEAAGEDPTAMPFKQGEECVVTVDGTSQLSGHIELVNVDMEPGEHTLTYSGRGKTADLIDSQVNVLDDMIAPIHLVEVIQLVIDHLSETAAGRVVPIFDVLDQASPRPFIKTEDALSIEPGDSAWEFIEELARKRQVLLLEDESGNMIITPNGATGFYAFEDERKSAFALRNLEGDKGGHNNLLSMQAAFDDTGRFNAYVQKSQLNPARIVPFAGSMSAQDFIDISQSTIDNAVRRGRQMVLMAENPGSAAEMQSRADWEANIRRARGRSYQCTVDGFSQGGRVWEINKLVNVQDDFAGISSHMLINSVTFNFDRDTGRTTELTLVEPDSYTLDPQTVEPDTVGEGLTLDHGQAEPVQ